LQSIRFSTKIGEYEVRRYQTPNGKEILTEWLDSLRDIRGKIAIDRRMLRMENGNFGDHKFCSDGVWELRIDFGPGYRVYYGIAGTKLILLLSGGDKRTQSSDIARAVQYWHDWQRRAEE
jgi:putative addiction module killer protein